VLFLLVGCEAEQSKLAGLAEVATEEESSFVSRAAVEKLTDQAVLAKIAVGEKDADVRRAAVEKLTDQALLAKIAVEDMAASVRHAAVEKLTDQALLAKIAVEDMAASVRHAALEKLSDQAVKPSDQEAAAPVTEEGPPKTEAPELSPLELAKVKPPTEEQAPTPEVTVEPEEVIEEPDKEAEIVAGASSERPSAPEMPPCGTFTIVLASFKQKQRADRYVEELKKLGIHAYSWEGKLPEKGRWYRVRIVGFPTLKEAKNYTKELRQTGR
jgi:septal ring-binding cell division protein DamX